ncbi:hypothetical protein FISHEDRAFT_66441 [Fistulina hepatica ATCC 64428]|uniref:UBR-type domain-containing protein n=1 Tax=Fistulina hepatica ATCC 64428 TaxID=1128425 RepID=A0A0D7A834_9AGAR|nr:hypothetical protein FISHEDRAFT_66441 [Fistulina hepatica ATCC 64428]
MDARSPDETVTVNLAEFVALQDSLVREAALALPQSFSQCSYGRGHIRQAVYLCLTCPEARGLCAACSIACHPDHEQIELFPKRKFRCDCPTSAIAHACTLHTILEDENTENLYGQNFEGKFCRCGREYDAKTEKETMIQCLSCEDWFHESCCNLRERPPPRGNTPVPVQPESTTVEVSAIDDESDTSSDGLPPPLLSSENYEAFVCGACTRKIDTLVRYAGTLDAFMVVRNGPDDAWHVLETNTLASASIVDTSIVAPGDKRPRIEDPISCAPVAKRLRVEDAQEHYEVSCTAPAINPAAQALLAGEKSLLEGTGDLFLTKEDFRERWCKCKQCLPSLSGHPFLLEDEETWEPPEDGDSGLSLETLGMRALNRMPRDRAIDGIAHYNAMRDQLMAYLRPFAQEGKVVADADVQAFFEKLKND